ncbi:MULTISPECIES: MFS transporter [unclassified Enterococcus]|jgi:DHA2 family lincomycin resistance protein-like MFS transporter|uniref:MFS transporter n=1 Tax=unclassified Enterococcus TaxID=2608891 RepID=UPI003D2955EE
MNKQNKLVLVPAVLATGMMSFAGVLIETAMNVTFPTLIRQFQLTTAQVQWVTTIYLLMISIIVPLSTYLNQNYNIRKLFLSSNLLFLLGIVIDFFSPTFMVLLLGRVLQGIATGIALPLMFHIILSFAPLNKRGTMIGVGTLVTAIAPAIGPTYGGLMTAHFTWNHLFLFLIPVLLLSLIIGLYAIPNFPVKKSGRLDWKSLLGLCLFFGGSLNFLSALESLEGWISLLIGLIGFVWFYQRSKHSETPLIQLSVLKNRAFRLFLSGFLVYQMLLLGISFILPNFVQIVQHQNPFIAGLAMLPGAAIGAILSPMAGKLLDSHGPKKPILLGLLFSLAGLTALLFLLGHISLGLLIGCHVIFMLGVGLSYSNMMTVGMNQLTETFQGDGNALFNTLQQFSGAVATSFVAVILHIVQDYTSQSYVQATTNGSKIALVILLILLLLSAASALRFFNKQTVPSK